MTPFLLCIYILVHGCRFCSTKMILSFNRVCLAFFDLVTSFIKYVSPTWSLTLSLFYLFLCLCCPFAFYHLQMFPLSFSVSLSVQTLASLCVEGHSNQFTKFLPSSHLNNACHKLSQSLSFGKRDGIERNCISKSQQRLNTQD